MITLEEFVDKADCFVWGHDWRAINGGKKCRNCGEVRR